MQIPGTPAPDRWALTSAHRPDAADPLVIRLMPSFDLDRLFDLIEGRP